MQVLIPRTMDVAKIASVHEQQAATQQQQLSVRLKQAADDQQHQVQTTLSSRHDPQVTTEDLDREKQKKRKQRERQDEKGNPDVAGMEAAASKPRSKPADPVLGHTIDIKT
jgi:hypothetical protein